MATQPSNARSAVPSAHLSGAALMATMDRDGRHCDNPRISSGRQPRELQMSFKQQLLALQLFCVSSGLLAQGAVVTPPPSLVIDGVPAISTSLADSIDRYGDIRRAVCSTGIHRITRC